MRSLLLSIHLMLILQGFASFKGYLAAAGIIAKTPDSTVAKTPRQGAHGKQPESNEIQVAGKSWQPRVNRELVGCGSTKQ